MKEKLQAKEMFESEAGAKHYLEIQNQMEEKKEPTEMTFEQRIA